MWHFMTFILCIFQICVAMQAAINKSLYIINKITCVHVFLSLLWYISVCLCECLSVCVLSLGKKMTRQEDQKHIFNFVWPYYFVMQYCLLKCKGHTKSHVHKCVMWSFYGQVEEKAKTEDTSLQPLPNKRIHWSPFCSVPFDSTLTMLPSLILYSIATACCV